MPGTLRKKLLLFIFLTYALSKYQKYLDNGWLIYINLS